MAEKKSNVSAFLHIELVHPDPEAAGLFMAEVFGAERIDDNLAEYVEKIIPGSRVVHMVMGNVVFQFVKPTPALPSWHEQLERIGSSIHNISITLDDLGAARDVMVARGCIVDGEYEVDLREGGLDSDGPSKVVQMNALKQVGMRFEMLPTSMRYIRTPSTRT